MKIEEIILFTNQVEKQKEFYQHVLDFDLVFNSEEKISFKIGDSLLSFQYKKDVKAAHFAFNIPSNRIDDALVWLKERVTILPDGEADISNFESWNAQAIYFYDADHNIVEYIARQDLNIASGKAFSSKSILSISEIAMATTDISEIYETISSIKPIPVFDGNFERFCALGNHEGLFILIDKNIKTWHPTGEQAYTADFIISGDYNFSFIDGKIHTA